MKNAVAKTILEQLGGNRFLAMTGAHTLSFEKDSLIFKLRTNEAKICAVKIQLDYSRDLYNVTFYTRVKKFHIAEKAKYEGVYVEDLTRFFTDETGLLTSL